VEYGRTWEGRPLVLFILAGPARMAALTEVQAGLRALADSRALAAGEADRLVRELPVVVWLMHAVQGNAKRMRRDAGAEAPALLPVP
jgi:hypothetical protein